MRRRTRASRHLPTPAVAALALLVCSTAIATRARAEDYSTPDDSDAAALTRFHPLIVNGVVSAAHPSTGALLVFEDASATTLYGLCSGTLIGCRTFLTAAHCVCPEEASDARSCLRRGVTDAASMRVFLQNAGFFDVASVGISPDYSFAERADFAVLTLSEDVTGIAPSPLNTSGKPSHGVAGTIVGFGMTQGGFMTSNDAGVKREGSITTATCPEDIADAMNVCWEFSGSQSNVCSGDSGGPLFVDLGGGPVVAGVTSGSYSFDCEPPDTSFDSDVSGYHTWIETTAGVALESESCELPAAGTSGTQILTASGELSAAHPEAAMQLTVPAGTTSLRVALNGQLGTGAGFSTSANDYDLYLRAGSAPSAVVYDCADTNGTTFGYCEIPSPAAGSWNVLVRRNQGAGTYQLTATLFTESDGGICAGDCNGDGVVSSNELDDAIEASLGRMPLGECARADRNGDGVITIDDLVAAVRARAGDCGAE